MRNILFIFTSLFMVSACYIQSGEPIIGPQFEKTVGKETALVIATSPNIIGMKIASSNAIQLTHEQMSQFRHLVLNDSSYIFDMKKRCLFIPQFSYKFQGNPDVTIFVSPSCNQIRVVAMEKSTIIDYDHIANEFNAFIFTSIK